MRETIDTTYADLRPTDLVIDKSGQAWPVNIIGGALDEEYPEITFWLQDPVTKINLHLLVKPKAAPVKVSRLPTQADEAAKLEADFDVDRNAVAIAVTDEAPPLPDHLRPDYVSGSFVSMAEAVAAVEEIGGTVEAEVTAEEVDAAAAATDDAPVSLPLFADMTPLEQRSHLYLLHGLYGSDVTGRAELAAIHDQAHAQHDAGTLNSRHVPHVHEVKK